MKDVDLVAWRSDTQACNGKRSPMSQAIQDQKNKLLGLDEIGLVSLLGKPDRYEIYKRNQKFYYYFLEPSEKCATPRPGARRLVVRFNAVGLANEVTIE